MKKKLLVGLATVVLMFSIVTGANAELLDNDWYTTDTESGLDWLDLTMTTGVSMDEIIANSSDTHHDLNNYNGWLADGWRYATVAEIDEFWSNFSPCTSNTYSSCNNEAASELYSYVGKTSGGTIGMYPNRFGQNNWAFVKSHSFDGNVKTVFYLWSSPRSMSEKNDGVGSWLVRKVNAPDNDNDGYTSDIDCNDNDSSVFPGAPELCDGKDNNCDGIIPENEVDFDGDTFLACEECDDNDASINPNATENPSNFIDENCDGDLGECWPCLNWKNHGQYVRCVAQAAEKLVADGMITEDEGDAMVTSAAKSQIGYKNYTPPECQ